jgi:hypothetical protein
MTALITVQFVVPVDYNEGDYARLHGNGGSGNIDWNNPLSNAIYELFLNAVGIYGWGYAPWGDFRWGYAHSLRTTGWGDLPWGQFPWGHGSALIKATDEVNSCGEYKFGFACYDSLGNLHEGSPQEVTVEIHIAPSAPSRLTKNSYNKDTDILVLNAA